METLSLSLLQQVIMISSVPVTSPRRRRRMLRIITNGLLLLITIGGANINTASSSEAPAKITHLAAHHHHHHRHQTLSLRRFNSTIDDVAAVNQDEVYLQCWKGWGDSHAEKEEEDNSLDDTTINLHHHHHHHHRVPRTAFSSCQACSNKKGSMHDNGGDSTIEFHALVWLPWDNFGMDHPTHDTWIAILTSLLLSNRFRLTIFLPAILHETTTVIDLQHKLLSGIPCDHPVHHVADWERIIDIQLVVPSQQQTNLNACSHGTRKALSWLDPCQIQRAPSVMQVLDTYLQEHQHRHDVLPDFVLTDITAVATFWVAERYQIPTVAVTDSTQLNDLLLSQPAWSPSWKWSWWKRLRSTLRQRWSSLQSTQRFMLLNRQRKAYNLSYYRQASDFFASSIAIVSEFGDLSSVLYHDLDTLQVEDEEATTDTLLSNTEPLAPQNHWQQFYITGPLLTPCVACPTKAVMDSSLTVASSSSTAKRIRNVWRDGVRHAVTSSKYPLPTTPDTPEDAFQPRILVMVPPSYLSPRATQTLVQGLSLAESSLEAYDDCDWDSTTCQKWMRHLDTVWMAPFNQEEEQYLPPVLGSHLRVETSSWSIWDTLDRYHSNHHEDGTSFHKPNGIAVVLLPCRDQRSVTLLSSEEWNLSIICLLLEEDDMDVLTHMHNPRVSVLRWVPSVTHSRQVASTLLHSLRYRQRHRADHPLSPTSRAKSIRTPSHHPLENLQNVQSMLERIVRANRDYEGAWTTREEMTTVLRTAVFSPLDDSSERSAASQSSEFLMYDAWTIFVAWIIVWISIAYLVWHVVILGSATPTAGASHHRLYPHFDVAYTSSGSGTASSSFWTRPDLLDVWILGREWYQRQPDSWWQWVLAGGGSTWDDAALGEPATTRAETVATNHHHHHRPAPALSSPARRKKRR